METSQTVYLGNFALKKYCMQDFNYRTILSYIWDICPLCTHWHQFLYRNFVDHHAIGSQDGIHSMPLFRVLSPTSKVAASLPLFFLFSRFLMQGPADSIWLNLCGCSQKLISLQTLEVWQATIPDGCLAARSKADCWLIATWSLFYLAVVSALTSIMLFLKPHS